MALHFDSYQAPRTRDDLEKLIRAILAANPSDETDWLEWKGTLDLSSRSAAFDIARTVLGFSNRMPERAALNCEGASYMVVGATAHDTLLGVTEVDGATLEQAVESYVGSGDAAPRMSARYEYFNVPTAVHTALMTAPSLGRYFDAWIRPTYRYRRIR